MSGGHHGKGRAIFFAAILVLSIFVMSAALTGSAAAESVSEGGTEIHDWTDLNQTRDNPDLDYTLMNDLNESTPGYDETVKNVSTGDLANGGKGFVPIGSFSGTFDGNGHTINDLAINASSNNVGLFSSVAGTGTVKNLTLADADVENANSSYWTGTLAGELQGTAQNITVTNSNLNAGAGVGGLTGYLNGGTIQDTSILGTGTVTGDYNLFNNSPFGAYGGLVGYINNGGTIEKSETNVTVKGAAQVGGILGNAGYGSITITSSEATGDVEGAELKYDGGTWPNGLTVGGLVGAGVGADLTIKESYATGTVTGTEKVGGLVGEGPPNLVIRKSYSTADITATESSGDDGLMDEIGGLVGDGGDIQINNSYAAPDITINNVGTEPDNVGGVFGGYEGDDGSGFSTSATDTYWDTESTGLSDAAGDGSLTATNLTTSEMQGGVAYENMAGFDFAGVWITQTEDYPELRTFYGGDTRVTVVGDGKFNSIQPAVDAAETGDTIQTNPGTYNERVSISTANVTLEGPNNGFTGYNESRGEEATITDQNGRLVIKASNVTIDGFNFEFDESAIQSKSGNDNLITNSRFKLTGTTSDTYAVRVGGGSPGTDVSRNFFVDIVSNDGMSGDNVNGVVVTDPRDTTI